MARLPKVKHSITIGTDKYSFYAADIYTSVGTALGVAKLAANDNTVFKGKLTEESFRDGKAIRVKSRASTGTGTAKVYRDFTFVVPFDKAASAIASIGSKTVTADSKTWELGDARIPQRVRLS